MKDDITKICIKMICSFIPDKTKRKQARRKLYAKFIKQPAWLGRHTYIGKFTTRQHGQTRVGNFCAIGRNVAIGPSQHPTNWLSIHPFQYLDIFSITDKQHCFNFEGLEKPCMVGNDVWIGHNVIISDGVNIADGCIIGANAVVTHDTEPYGIYVGVPARLLRYRFSKDIIDQLLELKWWDLPDEQIVRLPFNDVNCCIEQLKEIRKHSH